MKEKKSNPETEIPGFLFLKQMKDNGLFNPATLAMCLDILSDSNGRQLAREYTEDLALPLTLSMLTKSPFETPDESVDGPIRIEFTETGKPAGFDPEKALHILIVGEPGTGKTSMVNFLIARQAMAQGIKCWFFVKARDTEKLIRFNKNIVTIDFDGQIKLNPMQPPKNVSRHEWYASLWDMFIQAEAVYDGTKNFLIEQSYDLAGEYERIGVEPSLFELYDFIKEKDIPKGSRESHYRESALNRIGGMLKGSLRESLDCSSGCLEELVNENVIFNIGSLPASQQVFIVNTLIAWLFSFKENNKCNGRHFVIIDDAMLLFDANFEKRPDRGMPIINHHLAEVRKSKINMIVLGQFPSLMGQGIFGTSSVKIMFTLSDAVDADRILDAMGIHDREQKDFARNISKENRETITRFSFPYTKPFFSFVPQLPIIEKLDTIEITKEEKRQCNSRHVSIFQSIKPRMPYQDIEEQNEPEKETAAMELVKDILNDIYYRPFVSSTERAYDLSLSSEKAKRIYRFIENECLAEPIALNLTGRGGHSKFYCIIEKGYNLIQKPPKPEGSGGRGKEHIFTQNYLKEHLAKKGYEAEIEREIEGKKIDLFCTKDGQKIAIEICVSTFKTEYINVIKDTGKCDRIVIVCADSNAKKKLLEELGALKDGIEIYALYEFLKAF
ncbi:MAG: hypothetical protein V1762_02350 [Nitrospirota bacterium]